MIHIDRTRVMALFLRLSAIPDDERHSYDEIIENACFYIASHLKDPVTVNDLERVEFACAAVAVYDNTLLRLINDKTLCTADGRQTLSYKDSDSYKYAVTLRAHAIACINDIWADDTFSFAAVEG
ncbi:MAG: hypothetical protein K6F91_02205 [Ruminococcus sp.]|nr:hypothetical protein [Ruminococcus sp.]